MSALRVFVFLSALFTVMVLAGPAAGQQASSGAERQAWNRAEAAYREAMQGAVQVIAYLPVLTDGSLVNALKAGVNMGVPITIVSSERGMLDRNGYLLTLAVQPMARKLTPGERLNPTIQLAYGQIDPHLVLEVQTAAGWRAYHVESGMPVQVPIAQVNTFNVWFAKWARQLPVVDPVNLMREWARVNLGRTLY